MKTIFMACFGVLKGGEKKTTHFWEIVQGPLREKQKPKKRRDWVECFPSHISPRRSGTVQTCRKASVRICSMREDVRERWLERRPVSECFIIPDVAFPPKALSKVSERREPRPELFKPLVTTWSKAALHFLIFALEWEPLHRSCVCEHSGAFYLDLISPCMFKSVLLPKKGMWYEQKRSNIFRMINWQSKANIIVRDIATVNILKENKLQMIWWDYCSQSGFCSCKNPSRCKMEPGNLLIYVVICVRREL